MSCRPPLSRIMNAISLAARVILILGVGALVGSVSAQPSTPKPRGSFVSVPGSRLHYEECGTGAEAVVLIHDGVVNSAVWDDVWPAFCRRFHTIRYDRRGFGRSPVSTTWHSETDDLLAILRQTGVTRATLVGSSHGGEVSIDFALAHPTVVRQLVLVGAVVGGFPYSEHFIARVVANYELLNKGDVPGGLKAIANDRYVIAPGNDAARKKLLDLLVANPHDVTHSEQIIGPKPALARLAEIRVPTLLLVGDADIPDVHAHAGAIEAGIPRARRIVIRGVGHLMYLEKPDEFARTVIGFIETNPQ
jgi:3-oxoadipate enol-lactonase